MKKQEFLDIMTQNVGTIINNCERHYSVDTEKYCKDMYPRVIDCIKDVLSQSPDDLEIPDDKTFNEVMYILKNRALSKKNGLVGPLEATEILAEYLGVNYSRKAGQTNIHAKNFIFYIGV